MIELLTSYRTYYSDIIRSMINWILIYTIYTNMITITDIPLVIPVLSHVLGPKKGRRTCFQEIPPPWTGARIGRA